jgi:hypothetical protein
MTGLPPPRLSVWRHVGAIVRDVVVMLLALAAFAFAVGWAPYVPW